MFLQNYLSLFGEHGDSIRNEMTCHKMFENVGTSLYSGTNSRECSLSRILYGGIKIAVQWCSMENIAPIFI
jgi:hypothetical protein